MRATVLDELRQHFRPEFLNRVDEIIVFHALNEDELLRDRRPQLRRACASGLRNAASRSCSPTRRNATS